MPKRIELELPDELGLDEKEVVMLLAAHLYERGHLAAGQAAALVGVSKRAFLEDLGRFGVSIFNYPAEDLKKEYRDE